MEFSRTRVRFPASPQQEQLEITKMPQKSRRAAYVGQTKRGQSGLIHRVSKQVKGLQLAEAFVIIRREGFRLRVASIDKKVVMPITDKDVADENRLNVDVIDGAIKRVWIG